MATTSNRKAGTRSGRGRARRQEVPDSEGSEAGPDAAGRLHAQDAGTGSRSRRALEASHQQAIEQATQIQQARIQSHAQLHAIDSELGQLNGLNWLNLRDAQPYVAEYLWNRRQELLAARPTASQQVEQVERLTAQQRDQLAEQGKQTALQRRMEAADRAAREIPGWNEELANAVSNTVMKAYGITAEELRRSPTRALPNPA